jgi:predicted 3-demethylubiquinone-9 3-methyltransferase (glyoxalase superfamily)
MQKIIPHLWFNTEAKEAAAFYASVFPDSKITSSRVLRGTPSGDCDVMTFDLMGYSFMSISAGPYFKLNPSISFMVNFDPSQDSEARTRIDEIWAKLSVGGMVLMPLQQYPFSERYGWIQDKYGVSWQLIFTKPEGEDRPRIIPSMLFVGDKCGKAIEASDFYLSVFKNPKLNSAQDAKRGALALYGEEHAPNKAGTAMFTDFMLAGQWFAAMDSAQQHNFAFNEAVSFIVNCDTQEEIDYFWEKLSAVPEAEMCGWLKDKYGVSWQINPTRLGEIMSTGTPDQINRVVQAFLKMKKFDLATLEAAYKG